MTDAPPPTGSERPPPGRRANALVATAYVELVAVDARVTEPLLLVLEDGGIAAYAVPSLGRTGSYLEMRPHPAGRRGGWGPTDALYADAAKRSAAEQLVAAELPGLLQDLGGNDDAEFAAIVASYDTESQAALAPWPVEEDADPAAAPARRWTRDASDDPDDVPLWNPKPYDEGHYEPPPPPPLPQTQPVTRYAIAAIVAGVLVLVVLPLFAISLTRTWFILASLAIAGGAGTLIYRMRDEPPRDSGSDDGAVV
jgi:hypothetical protein